MPARQNVQVKGAVVWSICHRKVSGPLLNTINLPFAVAQELDILESSFTIQI